MQIEESPESSFGSQLFESGLGMLACLGLVLATNAIFVGDLKLIFIGVAVLIIFGTWLLRRIWKAEVEPDGVALMNVPLARTSTSMTSGSIPVQPERQS